MKGKRSEDIIKVRRSLEMEKIKDWIQEAAKVCDCHDLREVPQPILDVMTLW